MANSGQKPTAAFVLSLLSGIILVLFGVICSIWFSNWPWGWMGGMMGWWSGYGPMMGLTGFVLVMNILGIIFGVVIIVSALMLYREPNQHQLWGILILVFSAISVVSCMGGMGIGLVLGVIGGILAIVWKP